MAAMLQHSPVALRAQQPQDNKMRFSQNQQEAWSYPQECQQQQFTNNPYYPSYQQYPPPYMYQTPQYRSHRHRTHSATSNSSGIQPQKSSSTPTSQQRQRKHRPNPSNTNDLRRPKSTLIQQVPSSRPIPVPSGSSVSTADSCRRSSITSTSSNVSQSVSIRSEMSLGTKLSLSKRLRKVFSVSSLRSSRSMGSLAGASSSNVSIATMDMTPDLCGDSSSSSSSSPITPSTPPQRSLRRRSFASLSTLFQKSAPTSSPSPPLQLQQQQQHQQRFTDTTTQQTVTPDKKDRPTLRVDTTQSSLSPPSTKKVPFKGRSPIAAPDSPNSNVSTRFNKQAGLHRLASELPSPTPSSSSTTSSSTSYNSKQNDQVNQLTDDFGNLAMDPPPNIGIHYGLPLHGSPRLKPAAHSSSSSLIDQVTPLSTSSPSSTKRRLQFCPTVQVHETFAASDYDRRCDNNATCQKLTPSLALKIKQEINEYKLTEMNVHLDSRQYTQFFL
ncbi:hypothetical protein BCR42DRAFT_374213 [Absidia repens]|uniref:Uncharacterized protein n=1 Tax=Absidia repens TaxID=90262 RepID=A0A1X2IIB9_9FUNG|nr:hypothetical protein BCR42DRAFT_374213 [Absidia repens]